MALKQWATGRLIPASIGSADEVTYNRHLKRLSDLREAKRNRYNNLTRAFSIETLYVSRGLVPYLTLINKTASTTIIKWKMTRLRSRMIIRSLGLIRKMTSPLMSSVPDLALRLCCLSLRWRALISFGM
jgi:hypothetical protein